MSDETVVEKRGRRKVEPQSVGANPWMTVHREVREDGSYEHTKVMWLTPKTPPGRSVNYAQNILIAHEVGGPGWVSVHTQVLIATNLRRADNFMDIERGVVVTDTTVLIDSTSVSK